MLKSLFEEILNIFKNHPKRVIYIISFIIFITLFIAIFTFLQTNYGLDFVHTVTSEEEQQIFIFSISLNNWCTILTIVGVFFTAIWAIHEYDKRNKLSQQEKASEIAKDFADNLMERMSMISKVLLENDEIKKMFTKIVKSKKLSQFTVREISNILNDKQCFNKYDKIIFSQNSQKKYNKILQDYYNENERTKFESNFPLLIENTLNHLEALCINITSQAAGSQFIYDSLHQSFLNTIEILSVKISSNNNNNVDKYFINIIQVYNMWNSQKKNDIKKLNKTKRKIENLFTQVDKEVEKLLTKKNKTV